MKAEEDLIQKGINPNNSVLGGALFKAITEIMDGYSNIANKEMYPEWFIIWLVGSCDMDFESINGILTFTDREGNEYSIKELFEYCKITVEE